jgi:alpha-beta hydrolase superfamily lysophospholipase
MLRSSILLALGLTVGCGAPPGSAAPPATQPPPTAPPLPPADHVALDIYVDGVPAGHESWDVTKIGDGTTDIAFQAVMEDKGAKISGSGTLHLAADLTTGAAEIALDTADGSVKGELRTAGSAMALTLSRGEESRTIKAEKPSNLFLPQPFFVGFAKLCPLFEAGTPPLVEFPGSPMTLGEKRAVGESGDAKGVTVYTVERGTLGKTLVACEKGDLIAALDPWSGESVARSGRKGVLDAIVAATTRKKPTTPDAIVEDDITVTVPATTKDAEAKLACSFMRPAPLPTKAKAKPGRFPTVVFLSGSGAQDRDEDTTGPGGVKLSIFKVLAIALAEKGIASVRCDDRGTARSTGTFDQATLSTFVRDAEEIVHAMYARPDVDPLRIGLIGHSEGAVVAPVVVHGEPKIRAVVLMAAPGRPIPDIAVVQQQHLLEQAGLPKDQIDKQLAAQAEVLSAIRKGNPLPAMVPPSERARVEAQRAWLKSHFDHDPQQALKEMPATAVLVVQGAKDLQVPVEEAELVRKGLASGKNAKATVIVYPTLNHLFVEAKDNSLSEYSDPRTVIDPTFIADTVGFLVTALTGNGK